MSPRIGSAFLGRDIRWAIPHIMATQMRAALAPLPAAALRLAPETVEALAEVVPLRNLRREAFPGRELYYLVT
jgi:hypothetical protein